MENITLMVLSCPDCQQLLEIEVFPEMRYPNVGSLSISHCLFLILSTLFQKPAAQFTRIQNTLRLNRSVGAGFWKSSVL